MPDPSPVPQDDKERMEGQSGKAVEDIAGFDVTRIRFRYVPAAWPTLSQPRPTEDAASVTKIVAGADGASPSRLNSIALAGRPQPAVGESCVAACADQSSSVS